MWGTIYNPDGYTLTPTGYRVGPWWAQRTLYERNLCKEFPLTYLHPKGYYLRPDRHGYTDLMSNPMPWPLSKIISRLMFRIPCLFHDDACIPNHSNDNQHGLFRALDFGGPYTFAPMTDDDAHELLYVMVRCDGGSDFQARWIHRAVSSRWGVHW